MQRMYKCISIFLLACLSLGLIVSPQATYAQEYPQDPVAHLQKELQTLLDAQQGLPQSGVDRALQADNCFDVFTLNEEAVPSGSKNIEVVEAAGALSGKKFYRQIAPGNAQLQITPRLKAPGRKLFYRFSVRNTSLLGEPLAKVETINFSTVQAGVDIVQVAGGAGWQTFSGSMVAGGNDAWVLTLSSAAESFALEGTYEFDAVSVTACDTAEGYMPVISFGATCSNGMIGRVMGANETVEQVANQQLIPPANISVEFRGNTRLACWASRQTQAFFNEELLDFQGKDRADSWNDFLYAFVLPTGAAIADVKPALVSEVVATSNKGPTGTFSNYGVGKVTGEWVILGVALGELIDGMTGYLQHKAEKYLNHPTTITGRFGEHLMTHVPMTHAGTEIVKIYNLSNFPTSEENMKKVIAYTCLAYCDSAFIYGWVLVAQADAITGATLLVQNVTYSRYLEMVTTLATRLQLAPSPVLEAQKTKLVDDITDFMDEDKDDFGDDLPPIDLDPRGDDPTNRCVFTVAGELPGTLKPSDLTFHVVEHIVLHHRPGVPPEWSELQMWRNLRDVLENGKLVPSFDDITYQNQRPAPIGGGAYWALPLIDHTISYVCTTPKFPDMLPFALFEIDTLLPGTLTYPFTWTPMPEPEAAQ